jgi:hypothetical protein
MEKLKHRQGRKKERRDLANTTETINAIGANQVALLKCFKRIQFASDYCPKLVHENKFVSYRSCKNSTW